MAWIVQAAAQNSVTTTSSAPHMRNTTNAQRKAAAAHTATLRAAQARKPRAMAIVGTPGNPAGPATLDQLYFSGAYPNYANSPLPNLNDTVNCAAPNFCGIRKFVDTLPLLNQANDLGNMLPVAVPDTTTFPGSDYYEISLVQYRQQLHKDLPAVTGTWPNQSGGTLLRGYVQTNGPVGSPALVPNYLGPIIVSQTNRPVRIKFTNALPTGAAGNLFVPVDQTSLGAGLGLVDGASPYLQNRATIHMHGGNTPWISDGTPHQWTIPTADWLNTKYPRGASVQFVPDMFFVNGNVVPQCAATVTTNCSDPTGVKNPTTLPAGATNDPGNGSLTFYYTNQQSGRLLFYHDHSYGITRLNVYGGEASAMLIQDQIDTDLTTGSNVSGVFTKAGIAPTPVIPAEQIPLVIQDKTFVPQNPASTTISSIELLDNGSGYAQASTTVSFLGGCATEPVATPVVGNMMDPFGQYITGAVTGFTVTSWGSGCTSDPVVTITGNSTTPAVAFAAVSTLSQQDPTWDSALWGGYGNFWYPHVYMTNQWPGNPDGSGVNPMGRWDYASWFWPPFIGNPSQYTVRGELPCPTAYDSTMTCPGVPSVLAPAPSTEIDGSVHQGQGSLVSLVPEGFMDTPVVNGVAYPTVTVDPKPYRFRILSIANERTFNLSWFQACGLSQYTPTLGATCPVPVAGTGIAAGTEIGMVPAVTTAGFPVQWPSDGRVGGVPDPAGMGPNWVVIGTEGGVLPAPATIPPTPVSYEQNLRSVTVTNIQNHGLLLMSAERSDAIVDFTAYAGKTLILYNDAPAPAPGHDDRLDYYTSNPDFVGIGGAPSTIPGFGPNTRTLMQVVVRSSVTGTSEPAVNIATLNAVIPAAFNIAQPPPIVPEPQFNAAYGQSFPASYPTLHSTNLTFTPIDPTSKQLSTIVTNNPAAGGTAVSIDMRMKTIQELFDLDYGRMNATLGTELPFTNFNTQTTIPLGYIDPFTEDIYDSANTAATPVGVAADGSQLWMIVHNGVDSHAIHFHLIDVQLLDRYGWDGTLRVPFPEEMGWKDTVRMNPLEIDFVALRPMSQKLPFPVPDSARLFDVTKPAGSDVAMSNVDPIGGASPQTNQVQPMGWEYVWHCHLLGHEENDMMRETVFQVSPQTPANVTAMATMTGNLLTFTDKSLSESGFNAQRADDPAMTLNITTFPAIAPAQPSWNTTVTWKDTTATLGKTYYYQVQTWKPDADYWTPIIGPLSGPGAGTATTLPDIYSQWSPVAALQFPPPPTVTSINPLSATKATFTKSVPVVITGTNFTGANGVTIAGTGVTVSSFTVVNATTINATLSVAPTAAVGNRNVQVLSAMNQSSNPVVFTTLAGPSLTAISPNLGLRGATTPITITGTDLAGATSVTMSGAGVACAITGTTATTVSASCTILSTATSGARAVSVATADGTPATLPFTIVAPTLTSIAPASATKATTTKSVPVVLTGTNLAGVTAISVGGTGVTVSSFTVVSATTINATLSIATTATTGNRNVQVVTSSGTTNAVVFATLAGPSLTAVSPNSGLLGNTVPVVLTGTDLAAATVVTVSGTGVTCTITGTPTSTTLNASCVIAATATIGARTLTVTTPDGVTPGLPFTVLGPTLTSIAPASATKATTTKSVPVVLTGTNLSGATGVTVAGTGVTVSSFTVVSSTTINATLSIATTAAIGNRNVQVVTPGVTTNPVVFATLAGPSLIAINPNSGFRGTTVPVTFTGTDLAAASAVMVSGTGVTCTITGTPTSTTLTANCAIGITATIGAQTVTVTTPDGVTAGLPFTVQGPTLTSISPASASLGTTAKGVPVVLTGTNLTGATAVTVAGTGVTVSTFSVVSGTTINANVSIAPTATAGTRNVQVVTPAGTSNPVGFTTLVGIVAFSGPTPALTTSTPNTSTKSGTITITNTAAGTSAGPVTLIAAPSIAKVGATGGTFSIIGGGTCVSGFVINPGSSCTIVVQYAPGTSTATATANVTITDTGATTSTQTIANFSAN